MNLTKNTTKKIDASIIFGALILIAPPIGIYKMLKYPCSIIKKSLYIFLALAQTAALINVIFFPNDPYKLALASYRENDYKSAIELLQLVPNNDADYYNAQTKKHEIENIIYPMGNPQNQWADDEEEYYYKIKRNR